MTTEIDGTPGDDTIVLPEGGAVIHAGGYDDDIFCDTSYGVPNTGPSFDPPKVGAHLSASDSIDGGDDIDTVYLNGNYNLTFTATTMTNVENLYLDSNNWVPGSVPAYHNYRLVLDDATIAKGGYLIINGMGARNLVVDDRAETDGSLAVYSSGGYNKLIGGGGNDFLGLWHGTGIAHGRGGDDVLRVGNWNDHFMPIEEGALSGGKGHDTLDLLQVQLKMLHFDAASTGIEVLTNVGETVPTIIHGDERDNVFDLSTFEAPRDNAPITVNGLDGNDVLTGWSQVNTLDGGAGNDRLTGGVRDDTLIGGAGADVLVGGAGKDTLEGDNRADTLVGGYGDDVLIGGQGADWLQGGGGADRFVFEHATDSTGVKFDTIDGFDFASDRFDVAVSVSNVGVLNGGHLDAANFDPLLTDGLAEHLSPHGAVLYTPDSGSFASETFLVIDQNGLAGYQSGGDLVIHLTHAINADEFVPSDFV